MSQKTYRLHIRKESLKFSAAHMTVFPDGSKESLHGHNYSVEVSIDLNDISLKKMVSYSYFKRFLKEICEKWDEKVLLAEFCPFFKIKSKTTSSLEFILCEKNYLLPLDEVVLLPSENITAESLAEEFCNHFIGYLDARMLQDLILRVQVRIDESLGQGASVFWKPS